MDLPIDFSLSVDAEIFLKPLQISDASALFQLVDANRNHLRRFLHWVDATRSIADSLHFIKEDQKKLERSEALTLGIYVAKLLVGLIALHPIDPLNHSASIGYWIAEEQQGRGIVVKSTKALIDYAQSALQLHRLEIRCVSENLRSQKIPQLLGFSLEAILKEAAFLHGKYLDVYLYSLINSTS